MNRIHVFLVEDDPDWIKSMTVFLNAQEDMIVVGAAESPNKRLRWRKSCPSISCLWIFS